jgi:hypothetical protein
MNFKEFIPNLNEDYRKLPSTRYFKAEIQELYLSAKHVLILSRKVHVCLLKETT